MSKTTTYDDDFKSLMDDIDKAGAAFASGFYELSTYIHQAIEWTKEHGCTAHLNKCYSYSLTRTGLERSHSSSFKAFLKACGPIKIKSEGEKGHRTFVTFTCKGWQDEANWNDIPSGHPFEYEGDKDATSKPEVDVQYILDSLARLKKRETVTTDAYNLIEALEKVTPALLQQLKQVVSEAA